MQDSERPSILAVGMPEIFAIAAEADQMSDSADRGSDRNAYKLLSDGGLESGGRTSADLFDSTAGLLKWMIYSAPKRAGLTSSRSALTSRFPSALDGRMANCVPGELSSAPSGPVSASPDDSAFGIEFAESGGAIARDSSADPRALSSQGGDRDSDRETDAIGEIDAADNAVSFIHAGSAKQAIELLRVLRFDLMVTSDDLPDMAVSQLIARVRAVRPWQKWALVGSNITTQSEIAARTLGASAVFDAPADLQIISELAHSVASQSPARTAVGAGMAMADDASRGGGGGAGKGRAGRSRRPSVKRPNPKH